MGYKQRGWNLRQTDLVQQSSLPRALGTGSLADNETVAHCFFPSGTLQRALTHGRGGAGSSTENDAAVIHDCCCRGRVRGKRQWTPMPQWRGGWGVPVKSVASENMRVGASVLSFREGNLLFCPDQWPDIFLAFCLGAACFAGAGQGGRVLLWSPYGPHRRRSKNFQA